MLCSIVIPVKNGIKTLPECLAGIRKQTLYPQCEIIIIDSGSKDGTVEYLQSQQDVRLRQIPSESFNHGLTRNLGVTLATGNFVAMTVQDAIPIGEQWLQKMIEHFKDSSVAGVCGQQVVLPHKDINPHQWFRPQNPPSVRRVQFEPPAMYERLTPTEKFKACNWDDVNAMYRRETLLKIPFQKAFFAEDSLWAQEALRKGYTLIYDTSARVYHYHFQNYEYTYKRTLTQLYFGYKIFGHQRKKNYDSLEYLKIIYRNFKYKAHPKWISHNFRIIGARNKAFKDFYHWLGKGGTALDNYYHLVCKTPPQGTSVGR